MKALNVIATAYRATIEEQDDTIVWLSHVMKRAGADIDVLLRANAVNYAVAAQAVTALSFGRRQQKNAPDIAGDVAALIGDGITVYLVTDDAADRGIKADELIDGVTPVTRDRLAALYDRYDQVWAW